MKATLSNYRQSPRKVRLVANLIRGKKVTVALDELSFLDKRAAGSVKQVLESAVANAKENKNLSQDNLFIKEITIDEGITIKRHRPVSRGRAHPIRRHRSHIKIVLEEENNIKNKKTKGKTKDVNTNKKIVKEETKKKMKK